MKSIVALIIVLILGGMPINGDSHQQAAVSLDDVTLDTGSDWLLLVYMAGDNNLGRENYEWGNAVKMDLEEMENTMPSSGVEILALADMEGPNNTYLYDLERSPARGVNSPTINLSEVDPSWTDEVDMSDWRTLRDFLVYSLTGRSAENIMFVLWNHGAGWYSGSSTTIGSRAEAPSKGFALDTNSGGAMFLDEFRDAFMETEDEMGSLHMDLIGFDTCSQGMMEVYYQVAPWFDLAIGSEDEQPWYGYNYTFVSEMGGVDPLTPEELGSFIIQEFKDQYQISGEYAYASIALVDLSILRNQLTPLLDDLSMNLIERMHQNEIIFNHKFRAIRGRTELLGFENIDLGHFLKNLKESDLQDVIRANATLVLEKYDETVLDEWHQSGGRNPFASGISIYLPPNGSFRTDYDGSVGFLNFSAESLWDDLIHEFHKPVQRIKLDLSINSLDGDEVVDDVTIVAMNPQFKGPINAARVYIDRSFSIVTNDTGVAVIKNMFPGTYLFEVYNGTHVAETTIKVLNRAPIAITDPEDPEVYQGHFLLLDARGSYDPDGDLITFKWDLDGSDGLNGSDSTSPTVNLTFQDEGTYWVRLTVDDTWLSSSIDISIDVVNAPPVAILDIPPYVNEDEEFTISASASWDTFPDDEDLLYLFMLDGAPIMNWTEEDSITTNISHKGWHEISVRILDPKGDFGFTYRSLQVINIIPVANITGPVDVDEDEDITFSAQGSFDSPSDIEQISFEWYLDGNDDPISTEKDIMLQFADEGSHVLDLKVIDDDGSEDLTAHWFTVWNVEPVAVITVPTGPFLEDELILFGANSSFDTVSDISILNFSWDVDDDGVFDHFGKNLEQVWTESGNYSITLAVTDDQGISSITQQVIQILNKDPTPEIMGPIMGDEDDVLDFFFSSILDTPSDISTLMIEWMVDDTVMETGSTTFSFMSTSKGTFMISVKVIDDDGSVGIDHFPVVINNPPPRIILENVPTRIDEGEKFTAIAYKTYDNPSDMDSLSFKWYLDDELIQEATDSNLTYSIDKAGTHELKLVVTDDDGDYSEVSMNIEVKDLSIVMKFLDSAFSGLVLIITIALLVLILIVSFQMSRKMKELPKPMKKEVNDEEEGSSDGESDEMSDDTEDPLEIEEEDMDDEDLEVEGLEVDEDPPLDDHEDIELPEPPGLETPREAPPPPDFGDVDLPEMDESLYEN